LLRGIETTSAPALMPERPVLDPSRLGLAWLKQKSSSRQSQAIKLKQTSSSKQAQAKVLDPCCL